MLIHCSLIKSVYNHPQFPWASKTTNPLSKNLHRRPPRPPDPTENILFIDIYIQGVTEFLKIYDWLNVIPIVISEDMIGPNNNTHLDTLRSNNWMVCREIIMHFYSNIH